MRKILLLALFTLYAFSLDLTLEIVKDVGERPAIVIEDSSTDINSRIDAKFFKLLVGDLEVTAHFNVDNQKHLADFAAPIAYKTYQNKNYLLRYKLYNDDFGKLRADIRYMDLKNGKEILTKSYSITDRERYPFLAHAIIVDINNAAGFPDVSFLKRFVIFSKYTKPKHADIVISDYTLTYQKTVVRGGLNLFPKWANAKQDSFYYTAFENEPTLYRVNIYKGTRQKIISSPGMLVCSDVSDDGSKLLLTMAPKMQPDIYEYNLVTKQLHRVTRYPGIDVNGNYIENEHKVVFVSDRLGYPTIFSKRIGARAVERVVYHGRNNSACSAFGDYVVYSSRETDNAFGRNTFNLYLASTKSDYIRRLTANGVNIFPRFGIDGETIMYIKEFGRQSGLGIIRLRYNKAYIYPLQVGKIQSLDW
ncbi:Tol-Pal system protein TolB [Nitratiruptor sp. YY09-18]|uniref:Tol-Pal system protein TolB n=1 Tax=Nitratiruptor sp. YY09-18 TaxID=2724901 RepID=UPI001916C045|nr:Tol-Pal system protein TolB [Nitratiruptor sp. YY09-18]BCD67787.1 TolB protein [Nitratiruptor sp. YY09-18]